MRRAWKIALPVTCAALIGGAMTFELVHRHHMEQQKLAQEAQAFRVRAEHGDAEAEYGLCSMYRRGRGVAQSYAEAFRWCRKAADQNNAKAQYGVGYLYYYGYGVDGDFAEALRWFHLAADQKLPNAENEIGIAYEVGNGVKPDYGEAVRWYRLAADQGYAAAEYNLGWMYADGRGVAKDRLEARKWITRAADHGDRGAKQMLGRSWPALNTVQKFELLVGLVGGVFLLFPSRVPKSEPGSQLRFLTGMTGAFILCLVLLRFLSFAYARVLQPPLVVGAFGFVMNFAGGILIFLLLRIVSRNPVKWSLWASGFLFVAFNALVLARFNRLPTEAAVRLLLSVNGTPLGIAIASAVLLLRAKRGGQTGGPSGRDVNADDGVGELTGS
jgi:hypothetical protein